MTILERLCVEIGKIKNEMSGFVVAVRCFTNLKNSILIQSLLFAQFEKYTEQI